MVKVRTEVLAVDTSLLISILKQDSLILVPSGTSVLVNKEDLGVGVLTSLPGHVPGVVKVHLEHPVGVEQVQLHRSHLHVMVEEWVGLRATDLLWVSAALPSSLKKSDI